MIPIAGKIARPTKLAITSWALYDLANTVFSMNITSLYLPLWVVNNMGGSDADFGNAASLSMLMIFLCAPILGALSDRAGRRMPFLIIATVLCVVFTSLLGLGNLTTSLFIFIIAYLGLFIDDFHNPTRHAINNKMFCCIAPAFFSLHCLRYIYCQ